MHTATEGKHPGKRGSLCHFPSLSFPRLLPFPLQYLLKRRHTILSCHLALPRYLYTVFLSAVGGGGGGEGSGPPGLRDPSLPTSLFPTPVPSLCQ